VFYHEKVAFRASAFPHTIFFSSFLLVLCSPALINRAASGPLTGEEPESSLDSHLFQIKGRRKRRRNSIAWLEHNGFFKNLTRVKHLSTPEERSGQKAG